MHSSSCACALNLSCNWSIADLKVVNTTLCMCIHAFRDSHGDILNNEIVVRCYQQLSKMSCSTSTGSSNLSSVGADSSGLNTPERWGFLLTTGLIGATGSNWMFVKRISVELTTSIGVLLSISNVRSCGSNADRSYLNLQRYFLIHKQSPHIIS